MSSVQYTDEAGFQFGAADVDFVATKVNRAILPVFILDRSGSTGGYEDMVDRIMFGSIKEMRQKGVHEGAFIGGFYFSSRFTDAVDQVLPFTAIDEVKEADIRTPSAGGLTPMFEATYNVLSATKTYGEKLDEQGVTTDAFVMLVTDGYPEGAQKYGVQDVKAMLADIRRSTADYRLKSIYFGVIGIGSDSNKAYQQQFADDIGADAYFYAGDIAEGTIGKINGWFSSSVHLSQQVGASKAVDPNFGTD